MMEIEHQAGLTAIEVDCLTAIEGFMQFGL